jgi:YggT family protein
MFVIGHLLGAIATILDFLIQAMILILFVNALLSWVRPDPNNAIVMFLDRVSGWICDPIRRLFPTVLSNIDFAPFIAMLLLWFIRLFVVRTLQDIAIRL